MTHCCRPLELDSFISGESLRHHHRHHHRHHDREEFTLVDSIPNDGETVSPSLKKIVLVFNRNVTSDSVWANNLEQIDLWQGSKKVKIHIKKGRRSNVIIIRPKCHLCPGKIYKIRIKADLMARDGETLDTCILTVFYTDCD